MMGFIGAMDRKSPGERWAAGITAQLHLCATQDTKRKSNIL